MSEEDDWFERALREREEEPDERDDAMGSDGDRIDDTEADADDTEADADDTEADADDTETDADDTETDADEDGGTVDEEEEPDGAERPPDDWTPGTDRGGDDETDPNEPDEGTGSDGDADPFGGYRRRNEETGTDRDTGGDEGNDDDPFGGGGSFGEDDPFGGGSGSFGEDDPFGGGSGSFGEDDPFGGGSGSFGEGDPFGEGGGETTGFDETTVEGFDSDIDRTDIGIDGLDEMVLGGVPSRSLLTVIGGPGTGKTTFSLQFLNEALESGDRGVYITLEQSRDSIIATAEEKGWSFREYAEEGRLAVVSIDPIEMANSLASIRNDLTRLIEDFGADRLVLDSVSLLEMMYDHPAKRRSEVFGFTRLLKEAGVTTLLTSEASDETPYASRYGLVEYLTDGVFVLQYVRGSDYQETRLAVEIQKIRNANHSRETKPYEITNQGISVYRQANIF